MGSCQRRRDERVEVRKKERVGEGVWKKRRGSSRRSSPSTNSLHRLPSATQIPSYYTSLFAELLVRFSFFSMWHCALLDLESRQSGL